MSLNNEINDSRKIIDELFSNYVGLQNIKDEFVKYYDKAKIKKADESTIPLKFKILTNCIFCGNSGTGKKSVAQIYATMLNMIDPFYNGKIVYTDYNELSGHYIDSAYEQAPKILQSALGGVLYIENTPDFLYNIYGRNALDIIGKYIVEYPGEISLIFSGDKDGMDKFIAEYPQFRKVCNSPLQFLDYTDDELIEIYKVMLRRNNRSIEVLDKKSIDLLRSKDKKERLNAYYVQEVIEAENITG